MTNAGAFREVVVSRLRYLIDLQGKSVAAVEKEMGRGRGYVGDALRGEKRLSLEALLEVLDHLGVEPEAFFAGKPSEDARWEAGQGIRGAGEVAERSSSSKALKELGRRAGASDDPVLRDVSALVELVTRTLEGHGLVSADEIEAVLAGDRDKRS